MGLLYIKVGGVYVPVSVGGNGGGNASIYIGDEPPENPGEGQLWFDPDDNGGSPGQVGSLISKADIPPQLPNEMDDEFNGPALDAKWTIQHKSTNGALNDADNTTRTFFDGKFEIRGKNAIGLDAFYMSQPTPANGPWEFRAKHTFETAIQTGADNGGDTGHGGVGLLSTNGYLHRVATLRLGSALKVLAYISNINAGYIGGYFEQTITTNTLYTGIEFVPAANRIWCKYSFDGITWIRIGYYAIDVIPSRIGFFANGGGVSADYLAKAETLAWQLDWFRRIY